MKPRSINERDKDHYAKGQTLVLPNGHPSPAAKKVSKPKSAFIRQFHERHPNATVGQIMDALAHEQFGVEKSTPKYIARVIAEKISRHTKTPQERDDERKRRIVIRAANYAKQNPALKALFIAHAG